MPEVFQNIRVTLVRQDRVDPEDLCSEFNPQDDIKSSALQPGKILFYFTLSLPYISMSIL